MTVSSWAIVSIHLSVLHFNSYIYISIPMNRKFQNSIFYSTPTIDFEIIVANFLDTALPFKCVNCSSKESMAIYFIIPSWIWYNLLLSFSILNVCVKAFTCLLEKILDNFIFWIKLHFTLDDGMIYC